MKKRVLVFPCGSEIGLEIHRSLCQSRHFEPVGASSASSDHGPYVYRTYIGGLPRAGDPSLIPALNAAIARHGIDLVMPAHDSIVLEFAIRRDDISSPVVCPDAETCRTCRSKRLTYLRLGSILPVPRMYEAAAAKLPFPLFLKPDIGQGSKGTHLARDRDELDFLLLRDPSLLILERLEGPEYTVDCFTDRHGRLRFAGGRERIRVKDGISVDTMPARDSGFHEMAEKINAALPLRGPWFFQVKGRKDRELVLMEVAPRIAGGSGLHRALGVNLPLLAVFDALGEDVEILANDFEVRMDRALDCRYRVNIEYEHAYIDLEDCCVTDNGVSPSMAAFLFQCRNRGVTLHLLTRYHGDIREALARFRLDGIFDRIHQVKDGEPKSAHIADGPAVFIDDSFAERAEVKARLGIPVFAPDAVESLME